MIVELYTQIGLYHKRVENDPKIKKKFDSIINFAKNILEKRNDISDSDIKRLDVLYKRAVLQSNGTIDTKDTEYAIANVMLQFLITQRKQVQKTGSCFQLTLCMNMDLYV